MEADRMTKRGAAAVANRNGIVRGRLFDMISSHAAMYWPEARGAFACPLCRREFTREAVVGPNPALTLAHVIPDCFKGTLRALACHSCNSTIGHQLEALWEERHRLEDWM